MNVNVILMIRDNLEHLLKLPLIPESEPMYLHMSAPKPKSSPTHIRCFYSRLCTSA